MTRKMKDSGVEWIGEIPENWNVKILKRAFSNRAGGAWGEEAKGNENDRICIRIADFDYSKLKLKTDIEFTKRNYTEDIITKLELKQGDILVEKSGGGETTPVGRTILYNLPIKALYANFMDRLRVYKDNFPKFIEYVLVAFYQQGITKQYIKQTTGIQNLDLTSMLSDEWIVLPKLEEQEKIANYLDNKCNKIDKTIEKEKAVIEKLKEYKQSVITEAVTKGLNPDAPMKDSGVEWIGEIPEHWILRKLKTTVRIVNQKTEFNGEQYVGLENVESWTGRYIETKNDFIEGISNTFVKNDILFNKLRPYLAKAFIPEFNGICSSEFIVMRDYLGDNRFLLKTLLSYWFIEIVNSSTYGAKMPRASWGFIGEMLICYPSIQEQKEISDYLDKKCSAIDELISNKEKLIDKLTEYKKSLIYECVTGKREVQ